MPTLIAAVNPIGLTPAFLIPLFIDPPQHNGLLIQKLAPDGNIKAFENFEIEPNLIINLKDKSAAEVVQGGQGIWVFAFDATDIIVGQESGLIERLYGALAEGQFDGQPFLAVEVAQFCDAEELYHRALSAAFDAHRKVSSLGSEIWRDIVILRPAILKEIIELMPDSRRILPSDLRKIDVKSSNGAMDVFVSEEIYNSILAAGPVTLPDVAFLARSFGIYDLRVRIKEPARVAPRLERSSNIDVLGKVSHYGDDAILDAAGYAAHFLHLRKFESHRLREMIDAASNFKRFGASSRPFVGKTLAMIFDRPSTRARVSFEVAMRQLGGDVIVLAARDIQSGRGESPADTARVLSRYADAIVLVTDNVSKLNSLARHATVPVINGGTDTSHPCQLMADVLTFEEHRGPIAGEVVAWCGDGNNVARSWIEAAVRFGFTLRLATPDALRPPAELIEWARAQGGKIELTDDPEKAVAGARCVVTDTWVSMLDDPNTGRHNMLAPYRVTSALMAKAAADALFMHCLPAHRGEEVTGEVIDGPQSVVFDEAENRLHAQKGVLAWVLRTRPTTMTEQTTNERLRA